MSIRDPRWIGAWWLPFAGWGTLMTLVSIPLLLFPKNIRRAPGQATSPRKFSSASAKPVPKSLWDKIVTDFKVIYSDSLIEIPSPVELFSSRLYQGIIGQDFGSGMKRLSRNRVFMWKCIGYIFIMNGLGGQMMNMPKYIETQYRVSAAKASFLTG